jgi:uncharacterized protein (TIGR02996 family)
MTHEQGFLRDISEHPADDVPRLVFADWLEERARPGDAERAEFIRLQIDLARRDEEDPGVWALRLREAQLAGRWGKGWAGPLRLLVKRWRFRRGFVEQVSLPISSFLAHAEEIFALAPVGHVRLLGEVVQEQRTSPYGGRSWVARVPSAERLLPDLANCPHLARLRGLDLGGLEFSLPTFEALLSSPHFPTLEALNLEGTPLFNEEGFRLLARSPRLASLTSLALGGWRRLRQGYVRELGIPPAALQALVRSPHLANVRRLRLGRSGHDLTTEALAVLTRSPILERLTELALCPAYLQRRGEALGDLLGSPELANLRSLSLRRAFRYPADLGALLGNPRLANLRTLDLRNNQLDGTQARALATASHLVNLVELDLSACFSSQSDGNDPTPDADECLRALAGTASLPRLASLRLDEGFFSADALRDFAISPFLARLRVLSIQGPRAPLLAGPHEPLVHLHDEKRVGDAAALAFASARPANLVDLDLGNHRITDAGLKALVTSPTVAGLLALGLWNNEVGAPGAAALLGSAGLAGLAALDLRNNPLPPEACAALRRRFGPSVRYGPGPVPRGVNAFADAWEEDYEEYGEE